MKIYAFADVHGHMKALQYIKKNSKDADILIDCGDMSIFGRYLDRHLRYLNKLKKPVLVIDGNHEEKKELREACSRYGNITYIDRMVKKIGDVVFVGYGGGGFALKDKRFEAFAKKIKPKLKKHKNIVLVVHQPPFGTRQDLVLEDHVGNKSFRKFMAEAKPKLVLCGHIHENFNTICKIKDSVVLNPGPYGRMIKV